MMYPISILYRSVLSLLAPAVGAQGPSPDAWGRCEVADRLCTEMRPGTVVLDCEKAAKECLDGYRQTEELRFVHAAFHSYERPGGRYLCRARNLAEEVLYELGRPPRSSNAVTCDSPGIGDEGQRDAQRACAREHCMVGAPSTDERARYAENFTQWHHEADRRIRSEGVDCSRDEERELVVPRRSRDEAFARCVAEVTYLDRCRDDNRREQEAEAARLQVHRRLVIGSAVFAAVSGAAGIVVTTAFVPGLIADRAERDRLKWQGSTHADLLRYEQLGREIVVDERSLRVGLAVTASAALLFTALSTSAALAHRRLRRVAAARDDTFSCVPAGLALACQFSIGPSPKRDKHLQEQTLR